MELLFEMLDTGQCLPLALTRKTFTEAGGIIGRAEHCDWVITDRKRHLSSQHALINYRDGVFFLTDTSSNGIHKGDSGDRLRKGEAQRIEHGSVYVLGDFKIRASLLRTPAHMDVEVGRPQAAGSTIPDDAFLALDPLCALDQQERVCSPLDELTALDAAQQAPHQRADYARIDMENLLVPELVAQPEASAPVAPLLQDPNEGFWERFGAALGVDCDGLDSHGREGLAIHAAHLLSQCIGGLQQSLRTRNELKNELRLALTTVQGCSNNPLKLAMDTGEVLGVMLRGSKSGKLPAEQAISGAFRDLQAHQVALLAASRTAMRNALEHVSPEQLTLRFERDHKPLLTTSGSHWRAYKRYHRALRQNDDWSERLLARDFAQAYEEQIRLIATLQTGDLG
ncbi:type VI secretion system-associated FHA domain protein TagH [Pseudomonas sp. BP8]|uniref:type VI secretion system-associated FHA domain protein TagH n=1 Tax=Pseudomonas sp. BP8 TaxID=2817864 RepID=UPI001AE90394|nr:type VI secretion system-associated FHA domain protein TagH [Pseudomonas sp. BP8]MBP2262219.1 type VI secretion system protein ImpI [Pseudomonas sp. BP8]HDS1733145.1 type VI secretion system-associated FHA domain protein TagH [Pseudomonas putida]